MIYKLSNEGRDMTYTKWRKIGGCGIPNNSMAPKYLDAVSRWDINKVTLGQIKDACPYTGRGYARFATTHLNRPTMAQPYDA